MLQLSQYNVGMRLHSYVKSMTGIAQTRKSASSNFLLIEHEIADMTSTIICFNFIFVLLILCVCVFCYSEQGCQMI